MSVNRQAVEATPDEVWDVLADGWRYPAWVVGASRMRAVSADWPAPGAELHHSVGTWPLLLDDRTEVIESHPSTYLRVRAHAWPGGAAEVELRLQPSDTGTTVVMCEDAVSGPGRLVPRPAREAQLVWRNAESLRRLAFLAERRTAP